MNQELIDALDRLRNNRDFQVFMDYIRNDRMGDAMRAAVNSTDPVMIHRAQGAFHALEELDSAVSAQRRPWKVKQI